MMENHKTNTDNYLSKFSLLNRPHHLNIELLMCIIFRDFPRIELLLQSGADVNSRTARGLSVLHLAIKCGSTIRVVNQLLKFGADLNTVVMSHEHEGCTLLHFACLYKQYDIAHLLSSEYHVNPNVVAADGVQPVHFAVFNKDKRVVQLLLESSVSVETGIDEELFKKYNKRGKWRPDCGNKISLLTYAVLQSNVWLCKLLITNDANLKIGCVKNKTLLKYAVYMQCDDMVKYILSRLSKRVEEINHRDDADLTAIHYLHKNEILNRSDQSCQSRNIIINIERLEILTSLINAGADIYLLVNEDPSTLLINLAAKDHEYKIIEFLLPKLKLSAIARPLYFATFSYDVKNMLSNSTMFQSTIDFIIYNIELRREIGFPVLDDEINLMNDINREYSINFQKSWRPDKEYIDKNINTLKDEVVIEGDREITYYEIMKKRDRELRKLLKDKEFAETLKKHFDNRNYGINEPALHSMIKVRVYETIERLSILDECEHIVFPTDSLLFYLSSYCTREITKYLDNDTLRNFVTAWAE